MASFMTNQTESTFRLWRKEMGFTPQQCVDRLGRSIRQVRRYDAGTKEPDRVLRLAMLALSQGLSLDENTPYQRTPIAA
jgi:hypothetical protein